MPTTGAPLNVWYPDDTAPVAPLENLFLQMATSLNIGIAAMNKIVDSVADLNAVSAVTGMNEGDLLHVDEGNWYLSYNDGIWTQLTPAKFATTGARDTAFNKASNIYKVPGATAIVEGTLQEQRYRWFNSGWRAYADGTQVCALSFSGPFIINTDQKMGVIAQAPYTELRDDLAWHDAATNPERITPTIAGVYRVSARMIWAVNVAGIRFVNLAKNGTVFAGLETQPGVQGRGYGTVTDEVSMNGTTDYIEATCRQSGTAGLGLEFRIEVELIRAS